MTNNLYLKIVNPTTKPILKWFTILWIISIMLSIPYGDLGFFTFRIPIVSLISVAIFEVIAVITLVKLFQNKRDQVFFISLLFTFLLAALSGVISSLSILEVSESAGLVGRLIRNVWYLIPIVYAFRKISFGELKNRNNLILIITGLLPLILYVLKFSRLF